MHIRPSRLPSATSLRLNRAVARGLSLVFAVLLTLAGSPEAAVSRVPSEELGRVLERVPLGQIPLKGGVEGLDGRLMRVAAATRDAGAEHGELLAKETGVVVREGLVQVVVVVQAGTEPAVETQLAGLGAALESRYGNLLQASVPPDTLESLAQLPEVLQVRTPQYPQRLDIASEALGAMGVGPWQDFGFRGAGAKVAIADLGFDSYTTLLRTELPAGVTARSFRQDGDITGGGDPHGTAAAEVVHEVAPLASLYLVNFATEVELGAAVDWLITEKVHVISASVGWPGTAFGDGRGTVNDIVGRADAAGMLWVQGAGNFGQTHWSGLFTDFDGNGFHNFATGDEGNTITIRRLRPSAEQIFRVEVFLTWDDWDTFAQDYDLFLFRGETVVAQSTAFQNGKFPPVEHIVYTTAGSGDYWIAVQRFRASRRARLDIVVTVDYNMEYRVPSDSLVVPADSPLALSVGAVEPDTLNVRPYSSQGPTKDGRSKPDIVAGDQVTTATYGQGGFAGTSAAAPHVAGAAALVKGARPDFPPAMVRTLLLERARGPGVGQRNNEVGAGQVFLGDVLGQRFLPMVPRGAQLLSPPSGLFRGNGD